MYKFKEALKNVSRWWQCGVPGAAVVLQCDIGGRARRALGVGAAYGAAAARRPRLQTHADGGMYVQVVADTCPFVILGWIWNLVRCVFKKVLNRFTLIFYSISDVSIDLLDAVCSGRGLVVRYRGGGAQRVDGAGSARGGAARRRGAARAPCAAAALPAHTL